MAGEPSPPSPPRFLRLVEPRLIGPLFGAAVVTIAAVVIHRLAAEVHLRDIEAAVGDLSMPSLAWSLGLSAVSFSAMALYDVLAVRQVAPGRISAPAPPS